LAEEHATCTTARSDNAFEGLGEQLLAGSADKVRTFQARCELPDVAESETGEVASPAETMSPSAENA